MNIPLNIDWQQILLHLFNFIILFAILYFLLYEPVKKFMNSRTEYFKSIEDEAKESLKNAEDIKAEYENKLSSASDEINAMKEKARKETEAANQIKIEQAQNEADKILKDARNAIERDRNKMLRDAKNEISDIVTNAVEKIVSDPNTQDAYDHFLDSVKRGGNDE